MSIKMHVVLDGLPERVQETADLLDQALPGLITWRRFAEPGRDNAVRLEGKGSGTERGTSKTSAFGESRHPVDAVMGLHRG